MPGATGELSGSVGSVSMSAGASAPASGIFGHVYDFGRDSLAPRLPIGGSQANFDSASALIRGSTDLGDDIVIQGSRVTGGVHAGSWRRGGITSAAQTA